MKGTLPKPTLLELDEYDINQRIIEALTNTCSHAVIFSIDCEPNPTRAPNVSTWGGAPLGRHSSVASHPHVLTLGARPAPEGTL